jgi:hypothetical protein
MLSPFLQSHLCALGGVRYLKLSSVFTGKFLRELLFNFFASLSEDEELFFIHFCNFFITFKICTTYLQQAEIGTRVERNRNTQKLTRTVVLVNTY